MVACQRSKRDVRIRIRTSLMLFKKIVPYVNLWCLPTSSLTANRDAERSPSPKGRCWSTCGRTHAVNGKTIYARKNTRNNIIAIGIWSAKTMGALLRRRNRVRARRADGRVAGSCRRDGRPWLNCRRAAYTARHPTHSYTREARHFGTRLEGTLTCSNTLN
ncbi:hypothetical protein EVAR_61876_1 [Eumeta japonica]|uniref:Uncharacterized protein n=1 Tax=Eumeta variegata TaxID=151549 RepID=A0A4C1ZGS0_EUMVA|nr:hypothetical protein EVAR_61876_1 [Eumeta japonica]